jgi:hypothetical protein
MHPQPPWHARLTMVGSAPLAMVRLLPRRRPRPGQPKAAPGFLRSTASPCRERTNGLAAASVIRLEHRLDSIRFEERDLIAAASDRCALVRASGPTPVGPTCRPQSTLAATGSSASPGPSRFAGASDANRSLAIDQRRAAPAPPPCRVSWVGVGAGDPLAMHFGPIHVSRRTRADSRRTGRQKVRRPNGRRSLGARQRGKLRRLQTTGSGFRKAGCRRARSGSSP